MGGQSEEALLQNLVDAGCAPDTIARFFECRREERETEQMRILSQQRRQLLDCVHEHQRQLDCLDYLMDTIQKEKGSGKG